MASIGRYVLSPDIFEILRKLKPGANSEIQLADAIDKMARSGKVDSKVLEGKRFDCGAVEGYLGAIKYMANQRGKIFE